MAGHQTKRFNCKVTSLFLNWNLKTRCGVLVKWYWNLMCRNKNIFLSGALQYCLMNRSNNTIISQSQSNNKTCRQKCDSSRQKTSKIPTSPSHTVCICHYSQYTQSWTLEEYSILTVRKCFLFYLKTVCWNPSSELPQFRWGLTTDT